MIVATAGHVDHGKTRLVQTLTGTDTDRLADEKRRGMTIEAGFAHADLGQGEPIGFVDVPGHERFVRNMLAGVAAVDFALLVVAVDDGPMPQTLEHLAILDLLGIEHGACALTKIDRVAESRVREVAAAVTALLRVTSLHDAPLFPLSTLSGEGTAALRVYLAEVQRTMPPRAADGHFRLAVDRCFTRPGAGLVVTGAVLSGQARAGDELVASPRGITLRLRGIQSHGRDAAVARAGQRCALNLAGAGGERAEVERGDWIVARMVHAPTTRLDVQLRLLPVTPKPLSADAPLQLHLGAATRPVRATPLQSRRLGPGATGLVQLVLDTPVSALRGDRFILRDAAAQRIVGGGRVLDPFAPARGRARPERLADLEALTEDRASVALARLLRAHPEGVEWPRFAQAWNLDDAAGDALRGALPVHAVVHGAGLRLVESDHWQGLLARVDQVLGEWHAAHPDSLGLGEAAFLAACAGAWGGAPAARGYTVLHQAALRQRIAAGAVVREGFVLRLVSHHAQLAAEDEAQLQHLIAALQPFGLRPPPLVELARLLGLDAASASAFLQRAALLGHLVQVAKNRFFLPVTIEALLRAAREVAATAPDGRFDAASFRDRSGIGRNLSIQLLEFFDHSGITRFAGERRSMARTNED
jgi:selenocysteine-specific elongation factor